MIFIGKYGEVCNELENDYELSFMASASIIDEDYFGYNVNVEANIHFDINEQQ